MHKTSHFKTVCNGETQVHYATETTKIKKVQLLTSTLTL